MADVITRFKLETTQFDSKLRDSAQSLSQLTRHLQLAGKDFDRFAQQHVEAARSFGQVASGATNLKDELKDLVGAYNQVSKAYNALTQEQKQSDYGKAMAESLQQLQGRIKDVKSEMNSAPGMLDRLAEKFTINIDAIKLFNVGLQVAEGALNVAKDAFFNNEEQLDEWGRIVESSQSLYEGFLNALNTGDISGFLSNVGRIAQAARDAYDALDALGTYNAFNQINIERTRTGMTESIADFRGGKGTKEGVKAAGDAYKKELADRQRLENEAYIAAVKEMAAKRGANAKDLIDALSGSYGHYQDLKSIQPSGTRTRYIPGLPGQAGRYEEYKVAQNNQERLGEALRHLNDTELQSLQALGAQAQRTGTEIAQVDKQLTRVLNGRQGGSSGNGGGGNKTSKTDIEAAIGSIDYQTKKVQELQKAWRAASDDDSRQKIKAEIEEQQYLLDRMTGKEKFDPTKIGPIADLTGRVPMPDFGVDMKRDKNGNWYDATAPVAPSEIKFSDGLQKWLNYMQKQDSEKKEVNLTSEMSKIAGGVSGIFSGIESLGVELPQGLKDVMGGIQGMISILTSISTIVTAIQAISAADTLIPFARGGVARAAVGYEVPGNHFSGDMVPALLNSGETVLNRAQSGILAAQLEGAGGSGGGTVRTVLSGEQCYLMIDRYARRTGKGEMVFWR